MDGPTVIDLLRNILGATSYVRFQRSEGQTNVYVPLKDAWSEEAMNKPKEATDSDNQDENRFAIDAEDSREEDEELKVEEDNRKPASKSPPHELFEENIDNSV